MGVDMFSVPYEGQVPEAGFTYVLDVGEQFPLEGRVSVIVEGQFSYEGVTCSPPRRIELHLENGRSRVLTAVTTMFVEVFAWGAPKEKTKSFIPLTEPSELMVDDEELRFRSYLERMGFIPVEEVAGRAGMVSEQELIDDSADELLDETPLDLGPDLFPEELEKATREPAQVIAEPTSESAEADEPEGGSAEEEEPPQGAAEPGNEAQDPRLDE